MSDIDAETNRKRGRPKKQEVAPVVAEPLTDTGAIIRAITQLSRDPALNIANMQYLLDTRRALMMEEAEQAYNDAMALAQAEIEPIARDCENPQTRSKYASYTALDRALRPVYTKHGFAITFNTGVAPNPNDILV